MLGPLPRLYSLLVVVSTLVLGVALGAWLGLLEAVPLVTTTGALIGLGLAVVASWLLVHDFHRRSARAHDQQGAGEHHP